MAILAGPASEFGARARERERVGFVIPGLTRAAREPLASYMALCERGTTRWRFFCFFFFPFSVLTEREREKIQIGRVTLSTSLQSSTSLAISLAIGPVSTLIMSNVFWCARYELVCAIKTDLIDLHYCY